MTLRRAVVSGAGWTATSRIGAQLLQFAAGVVLSRLLAPSDFGLLAAVYVIAGFLAIFVDSGLGAAIVFLPDLNEHDLSTAFWLNALLGLFFTLALGASAPLIAAFFHEPRLVGVTWLIATTFTLSLSVVHVARLERALQFRPIAVTELAAAATGIMVSVIAALVGAGYWALALGPVAQTVAVTIGMWHAAPWRPRHFIARSSIRRLWSFSAGMLGFSTLNYWTRSSDNLLIGRYAGAAPLAYYNRAYTLMMLPVGQVGQALGRVMFPALSAMGDDHARVGDAYRKTIRLLCVFSFPVLVGLAAVADRFVLVAWGTAWRPTAPLLQLLCLAGLPQIMTSSVGWIYQSQGQTRLFFRTGAVSAVATVGAFAIGIHWGAVGVATAFLIRCWLMLHWTLDVPLRLIGLRGHVILRENAGPALAAAVMGGLVWAFGKAAPNAIPASGTLMLQIALGVALYVAFLRLADKGEFHQLRSLVARN
jgi:O-antigen/teichoic acid export membrane protein